MTLEERYELSCYETLSQMQEEKNVWLVRHNENGGLYVKKIIQIYNRDIYRRLMEIKPVNVPKIVMCVEEDSKLIVIEEFIHGSSLQKKLEENGVFSQEAVLELMMQLCDIIRPLHDSMPPMIHRDIKPANIMISNDGVMKLVDFNAAKECKYGQNEDTRLMGTKHFAAPEQYGFGQSDQRTDIYAMGITMYYLLTGEFPDGDLPEEPMGTIIEKCICLDRQNRYQSVDVLQADLVRAWKTIKGGDSEKSVAKERRSIFKHAFYNPCQYLPVGFRSGVLWKMILATVGYALLIALSITLKATDTMGRPLSGYPLWMNRIAVLLIYLGTIFFVGNYLGIRAHLPGMQKSKFFTWILACVYLAVYYIMIVIILMLLGGLG